MSAKRSKWVLFDDGMSAVASEITAAACRSDELTSAKEGGVGIRDGCED
jgi:hypothetical protein